MLNSWLGRITSRLSRKDRARGPSTTDAALIAQPAATGDQLHAAGTAKGWLRVLQAKQLLAHLHAEAALDATWRQSRLAFVVWERDLLTAIERYAQFVQLMPASESHHHAHAGGLLAHTLEMVLAAMTWRNGHFLPSGAAIEQIDEERDVWTYVVFFAALLHDIAKPLTDLRIHWRAAQMVEPLRWTPVAGNLVQLTEGRRDAEYLVEFTPKSLRDYGAHSRLAVTLLGQIAPTTALSFLARTPQAMDALTQYLSGQDKTSLVARLVARADQASTQKSLLSGSRARFETATSLPLIELLMNALKAMLRSGTALPLNRSGAAGWVYDGSVWFVAKRLADSVRAWVRQQAPDESIPGDSKNDRLFDTWQEYGCIQPNPKTGQAVWYVVVHGRSPAASPGAGGQGGAEEGEGAYTHALTMLRFPLEKLYDDAAQFPPSMLGHLEFKEKRSSKDETETVQEVATGSKEDPPEASADRAAFREVKPTAATSTTDTVDSALPVKPKPAAGLKGLREPSFNKPKAGAGVNDKRKAAATSPHPPKTAAAAAAVSAETLSNTRTNLAAGEISIGGGIDGFNVEDDGWLDDDDDVRAASKPSPESRTPSAQAAKGQRAGPTAATKPLKQPKAAGWPRPEPVAARSTMPELPGHPGIERPSRRLVQPLFGPAGGHDVAPATTTNATPDPVVLMPSLPELPQHAAARKEKPSETALSFIQWLQQGLASREIKYNEAGAPVHFTAEGMALVSPLIFKLFASESASQAEAEIQAMQVQREVIKAGWHLMTSTKGSGRLNILRYEVMGRGGTAVGKLSAVVLIDPDRWVLPVPPSNPVLRLV